MQSLKKRLEKLLDQIELAFNRLKVKDKQAQTDKLTKELAYSEVWNNPGLAQSKSKQLATLSSLIEPWIVLKVQSIDMLEMLSLEDASLQSEFEQQVKALEDSYDNLSRNLLFNGEYDSYNVILRLSAGVGGTDAQNWAEMLERMYLRWAERSGMQFTVIERSPGEEAGIKSSVIEINGLFAYGKLKGEHGVHRLVRLSPFNSDNLRQTSFALVEILPQIETDNELIIDFKDLKIDVYRSGGKGGQSVNTTDSAVRVTHLPTGITVAIQNERSQLQNKEMALKILKSKLVQLKIDHRIDNIAKLRAGESANWGSQIRNYVLHPYSLVKDVRTKHEERNVQKVLDGEIGGFIDTYLKANLGKE